MVVAMAGFDNLEEMRAVIDEFIASTGCYLFSLLTPGIGSLTMRIAEDIGAPAIHLQEKDPEKLLLLIPRNADFLIAKKGNQYVNRLIMNFRAQGKHGFVVE